MRRNQKRGDWLASDDLTGFTVYASKIKRGWYGEQAVKPYKRNLQEVASPLDDPEVVPFILGPNYENTSGCPGADAPLYVGNTTVLTNPNNAAIQALDLFPAIPDMEVGCSFIVYPG